MIKSPKHVEFKPETVHPRVSKSPGGAFLVGFMLNIEGLCLWERFRTVLSLRNSLRNRFALFAHLSENNFVPDLPSPGLRKAIWICRQDAACNQACFDPARAIGSGPFSRAQPRLQKRSCIEYRGRLASWTCSLSEWGWTLSRRIWWDDVGFASCVLAIQSPVAFSALGARALPRILPFKLAFSLTSR